MYTIVENSQKSYQGFNKKQYKGCGWLLYFFFKNNHHNKFEEKNRNIFCRPPGLLYGRWLYPSNWNYSFLPMINVISGAWFNLSVVTLCWLHVTKYSSLARFTCTFPALVLPTVHLVLFEISSGQVFSCHLLFI